MKASVEAVFCAGVLRDPLAGREDGCQVSHSVGPIWPGGHHAHLLRLPLPQQARQRIETSCICRGQCSCKSCRKAKTRKRVWQPRHGAKVLLACTSMMAWHVEGAACTHNEAAGPTAYRGINDYERAHSTRQSASAKTAALVMQGRRHPTRPRRAVGVHC